MLTYFSKRYIGNVTVNNRELLRLDNFLQHIQPAPGRNPKTGETMTISATRVPGFSALKFFKDKVTLSK